MTPWVLVIATEALVPNSYFLCSLPCHAVDVRLMQRVNLLGIIWLLSQHPTVKGEVLSLFFSEGLGSFRSSSRLRAPSYGAPASCGLGAPPCACAGPCATLSHYACPDLFPIASPQTHCASIGKLPASDDDFAILLGVQRIAHIFLCTALSTTPSHSFARCPCIWAETARISATPCSPIRCRKIRDRSDRRVAPD